MAADLTVEFESVESLAETLAAAAGRISEILSTLGAEVSSLRSQWTGDASDAYDSAHASWTKDLTQMTAMLDEVSAAVGTAHNRYRTAETGNVQRWN
jgi:WXG100 family type VII secretion target